jgi:hypothetical protein
MSKIKNYYHDEICRGIDSAAAIIRNAVTGLTCMYCQDEALERAEHDKLECTTCGRLYVINTVTSHE